MKRAFPGPTATCCRSCSRQSMHRSNSDVKIPTPSSSRRPRFITCHCSKVRACGRLAVGAVSCESHHRRDATADDAGPSKRRHLEGGGLHGEPARPRPPVSDTGGRRPAVPSHPDAARPAVSALSATFFCPSVSPSCKQRTVSYLLSICVYCM